MVAWSVLTLLFAISLLIIGLRHWEGWMFASITGVGWLVYSVVGGVRVVELIFNLVVLVVSVVFLVRWSREQKARDEDRAYAETTTLS